MNAEGPTIAVATLECTPIIFPAGHMNKILLKQLRDMFAGMRAETDWDVDGDLRWGYFFTDPDPTKLEPAAEQLAGKGYTVVGIYETDDKSTHFLRVERIETHTPESLHARNKQLQKLADDVGLESYDGMDVGPAEEE